MSIKYRTILNALGKKLLLDLFPGSDGYWALRKVRMSYAGPLIKIRRSSDNATQDIGFLNDGSLDTTAISSFVGANSAFVETWYDQSLNGRDFQQGILAVQPRIVNAGTLDMVSGFPALKFDGTDDYMELAFTDAINILAVDFATFIVQKRNAAGTKGIILTGGGAANNTLTQWSDNIFYIQNVPSMAVNGAKFRYASDATATFCILEGHCVANVPTAFKDNVAYTLSAPGDFTAGSSTLSVLGRYGAIGGTNSNCHVCEIGHYTADMTGIRASVESTLNSHFLIH
jgi:hypothetical protein